MKKGLLFFLILFLCLGCDKEASTQKKLNVLNWSSYIPTEVIMDFEKQTGISVNYSTYSSNEELLAKISNVKKGTYDLIFPSDYMIEIMIGKNLLEKMDQSKLHNMKNLNTSYLGLKYDPQNNYSLPFIAATTLIAVNTEKIHDNITSYNDLLNPKYYNDIVLIDDQRIIIGMALLANGYDMNSTNEEELKVAKNWLLKLKPNIKAYDSDSPKNFLISKEASIAVLWNAEGALAMQENPMIKSFFPKEGIALSIDNFAIPIGAKNLDAAYSFINYILNPEVMKAIIESYPYKNVNWLTDHILDAKYLTNPASNISNQAFQSGHFVNNIGAGIKLYDKLWIEIK
ncbi:MAG: spermidine/putrescine ABC transporter substrate-binding protein [Firmicutes bacterium]|nr:spermidine/putrescine ABC transporter substrate-binding protein [Bacillota bacterium]